MSEPIDAEISGLMSRIKTVPDAEADRLRVTALDASETVAWRKLLREAGLPIRHIDAEVLPDGPWESTRAKVVERIGKPGGSMICLTGSYGTGKTQLAVESAKTAVKAGKTVKFAMAMEFFMDVKETYKPAIERTEREVISTYRKPTLLILDEISKTGGSEWEKNLFFLLLNWRYMDCKDTILTSNHATQELLAADIGGSVVDRINQIGGVIECDWPSYRENL